MFVQAATPITISYWLTPRTYFALSIKIPVNFNHCSICCRNRAQAGLNQNRVSGLLLQRVPLEGSFEECLWAGFLWGGFQDSLWEVPEETPGGEGSPKKKILHFEWSPPWHHIITYLSQILTFFVLKSGEDEEERIILMKSRALRSLDFIRIILSSSSILLVGGPAVTTVIYLAKLTQTNSRYAWFKTNSDSRRPGVSRRLGASKRPGVSRRLGVSPPRPFSWFGVQQWPLWSIKPNWLKLTLVTLDSKHFQTPGRLGRPGVSRRLGISRRLGVSRRPGISSRLGVSTRLGAWKLRFERYKLKL